MATSTSTPCIEPYLHETLSQRIMYIDGAMGTMIQVCENSCHSNACTIQFHVAGAQLLGEALCPVPPTGCVSGGHRELHFRGCS